MEGKAWAWGLVANAGGGDWETQTPEWQEAAAAWRDAYHLTLAPAGTVELEPPTAANEERVS